MINQIKNDKIVSLENIDEYIEKYQKSLLRFITCGSVDDGKSTLIGRLLYDSKMLFVSVASLRWIVKSNIQEHEIDFSFIVDGLEAERKTGYHY